MARPRKELDAKQWESVESMCNIHCTGEEIAGVLGVSYDTLEKRVRETYQQSFTDYYKIHSSGGKRSLRRLQWQAAEKGNIGMLIWLGKQWLGQVDKQEVKTRDESSENILDILKGTLLKDMDV
jgi:hypothetical protein